MVILSGILTLTTTLLQIYWDYRQEINDINQKHYEVENVHSELLVSSLWSYDLALLQQHLDLLVNLPKNSILRNTVGPNGIERRRKSGKLSNHRYLSIGLFQSTRSEL
ncbi:hypothetical protein ACT691_01715 [Vibrio metschnikovii]